MSKYSTDTTLNLDADGEEHDARSADEALQARLRERALVLLEERDLRFFDGMNIYKVLGNESAGEKIRRLNNPMLDEAGAIALRDATRDLAMPNMDAHELTHLVHCLKFCPKLGAVA